MPLPSDSLPSPPFHPLRVACAASAKLSACSSSSLVLLLLLLLLLLLTFQSHCQYVGAALAAVDFAVAVAVDVAAAASELLIINILCTRLR